jgi:DNA repair ATPase RecN
MVSVAGSTPLLLDDALRGLEAPELDHLLGRLESMAEAVQVIVISEDPRVAAWAEAAGPVRAAVVRPVAAPAPSAP